MREKQEAEEKARLHHENVRRLKLQGFTDWAMQNWTFENDNGQNPQMQLAQRYVNHWPEMREKNVGLLLWGGVGTGKSFMVGCIANPNTFYTPLSAGIPEKHLAGKGPSMADRVRDKGAGKSNLHRNNGL